MGYVGILAFVIFAQGLPGSSIVTPPQPPPIQTTVKNEVVARVGEGVGDKEEVAKLLARWLNDMPGTLADRQAADELPRREAGLLELARYLREQEQAVRDRQARIEAIQAEISEKAWQLYRS